MAFLFIWQFILSGPLEIASGYIGFSRYARYIWPDLTSGHVFLVAAASAAQRRAALPPHRLDRHAHGQPLDRHAPDDRRGDRDRRAALRRGARVRLSARRVRLLARLSARPRRRVARRHLRLPRLLRHLLHRRRGQRPRTRHPALDPHQHRRRRAPSTSAINLSIIGVVPWREFVPPTRIPESEFIVSMFMERMYGRGWRRCSRC